MSVDQIESPSPGYVNTFQGKPTTARYHVASLYTDHASRFMYLKCHYSTGGAEAVEGKQRFEQFANTHGVKIKAYRADNGIMAKKQYMTSIEINDLWPFALKMAVDIHNATPGKSELSPEEIFTKQKARQDRLVDFHPFGCPVFVLDPKLQQGHKLPKWQPRA